MRRDKPETLGEEDCVKIIEFNKLILNDASWPGLCSASGISCSAQAQPRRLRAASGAIILNKQGHDHDTDSQHAVIDERSRTHCTGLLGCLGLAVLTSHSAALPIDPAKGHGGATRLSGSFVSSPKKADPLTGLRQLLIFQFKLGADALRDLLMSPVSILIFLLELILRPPQEQSHHEQLMKFGR